MSCRDVREWLHRDASTLDEAQRLVLDDHLATCADCRGDRDRLRTMHRVGASLPVPPPGAREYSRAIARALMAGPSARPAPPRRSWWIVPALAMAAIAVIAVVLATRHGDEPAPPREAHHDVTPPPPPHHHEPAPADVVEAGSLASDTATIGVGAAVPANVALRTTERTRVKLGALHVVIAASSEIRWSAIDRELVLERGSVELDSSAPGPTRIVTRQFEVELDNAAVTIDSTEVRVQRGSARVVDRSRKLIASLESDGTWRPVEPAVRSPGAKPADLLARARTQFAAKDYAGAERTATRALTNAPRAEEAEARIFLADVAQAAGKLDLAVARYEQVATKYAELPAAESALYDAARIEVQRSHPAEARRFLDRYLARYPSGRYADDVHRDLAKLP